VVKVPPFANLQNFEIARSLIEQAFRWAANIDFADLN
jgi:hypothetical protein